MNPTLISDIDDMLSTETQSERCHHNTRGYVKITALSVRERLLSMGHCEESFCTRTINNILNRLDYTLKKVRKTLPLKRIAETDAIFDNIKLHRKSKQQGVLQLSMDVKDKVRIGNLSRGGKHRQKEEVKALDKDQQWDETLVPVGIMEIKTGQTTVVLGDSYETSDFICDALETWYESRKEFVDKFHTIELYLDNGPQVESARTQFINRIMQFACITNLNIHLLYYPPYHSKYNPIERFWAAVEQYWSGTILKTADYAVQTLKNMIWKGYKPIVFLKRKVYQQGISLDKQQMRDREVFLVRREGLYYWDVFIKPSFEMGMLFLA